MIDKGTVSALKNGGTHAEVIPAHASQTVTIPLVISENLVHIINVGDEVVYATFDDNTGIILARLDGKWSHRVDGELYITGNTKIDGNANIGSNATIGGNVTSSDVTTGAVASLNSHKHNYTHAGTSSGNDTTSTPV